MAEATAVASVGSERASAPALPPLRRRSRARVWPGCRIGTDRLLQLALLALLVLGVWRVLQPFLPAILFPLATASCVWPAYTKLRRLTAGRDALAAGLACALVLAGVLAPAMLLVLGLADGARAALAVLDTGTTIALPAFPAALRDLPLVGADLAQAWESWRHDPSALRSLLTYGAGPARDIALISGRALANAALQAGISALLLYFLFRNGERLASRLRAMTERLCGVRAQGLIDVARNSVAGVMFGELGAGIAQGAVATVGFLVAGVPNPFFLGALTFVVSIVPIGPPLLWAGASLWLLHVGEGGWALFMVLYGIFGISMIDNVLKPLLISRASRMPFVFALIGVFGGVLGFGVVGVFLGPTLLALAADLAAHWVGSGEQTDEAPG